jgi:acetyl-CoA carboxylase biotin carboxylase subunit
LSAALNDLTLEGLKTTVPLHQALAADANVRADRIHTQWLEPWLDAGNLTIPA